ncbi:hypothetical protein EV182_003934 [Spiromyces aspiralis]|uniref:Uncharacterized protein n=1 Tax=Spiromyces aspiralis TaxID=68401 RepID=A0ACC1HPQ8_9FUNG|nr:hypothetical protein EV182_003934 [Spiromyces aspiralis]
MASSTTSSDNIQKVVTETVTAINDDKSFSSTSTSFSGPLELTKEDTKHLKRYYRKCDYRITLYLGIAYAFDYISREAISAARVANLIETLHLKPFEFNIALALFFVGHLLFQVFSNIILKKTKPSWWMSFLIVGTGAVSMSTAASQNHIGLYMCRLALGVIEAGIPAGALFIMFSYYPRNELGKRIGFFYGFASISNVISGPINAGITKIHSSTIQSWRIIFLLLGGLMCLWGLLGLLFLRDYPQTASFLSAQEKRVIEKVMRAQGNRAASIRFSKKQLIDALTDGKIWSCCVIGLCGHILFNAGALLGPVMLSSYGFSQEMSNGLNAIPNVFGFLLLAFSGTIVNRIGSTGFFLAGVESVSLVGFILALAVPYRAAQIIGLFIFTIFTSPGIALPAAWVSSNLAGTTKPVIASALISAVGSSGGGITALIYRDQDKPRYFLGNSFSVGCCVIAIVLALFQTWYLKKENRRRDINPKDISHFTEQEVIDLCDRHPDFRYRV